MKNTDQESLPDAQQQAEVHFFMYPDEPTAKLPSVMGGVHSAFVPFQSLRRREPDINLEQIAELSSPLNLPKKLRVVVLLNSLGIDAPGQKQAEPSTFPAPNTSTAAARPLKIRIPAIQKPRKQYNPQKPWKQYNPQKPWKQYNPQKPEVKNTYKEEREKKRQEKEQAIEKLQQQFSQSTIPAEGRPFLSYESNVSFFSCMKPVYKKFTFDLNTRLGTIFAQIRQCVEEQSSGETDSKKRSRVRGAVLSQTTEIYDKVLEKLEGALRDFLERSPPAPTAQPEQAYAERQPHALSLSPQANSCPNFNIH